MGSSTRTIRDAKIVPIMDQNKIGQMKKLFLIESGKLIGAGGKAMTNHRGNVIADLKGLYNTAYLEAMGYAPSGGMKLEKLDVAKLLQHTQTNVASNALSILANRTGSLTLKEHSTLFLQTKPGYDSTDLSILVSGKRYFYYNSVMNGNYVDTTCFLNVEDTVSDYLTNYTYVNEKGETHTVLDYQIINHNLIPLEIDGEVGWNVKFKYKYVSIKIVKELQTNPADPDGPKIEVEIEVPEEKWSEPITEFALAQFKDFSNESTEQGDMIGIATAHTYSIVGYEYIVDMNESDMYGDPEIYRVVITGSVVTTYLGEGDFNVEIIHTNPYPSNPLKPKGDYHEVWEGGVAKLRGEILKSIQDSVDAMTRKIIWTYNTSAKPNQSILTYASGSILKSLLTTTTSNVFPIIPLKKNFALVQETRKLKVVLKKLGMERDDFTDSLSQKEIYDAYLMFGLPFKNSEAPAHNSSVEYIFEFFAMIADIRTKYDKYGINKGEQHTEIYHEGLGIYQTYSIETEVIVAPAVKPMKTYWTEVVARQVQVGVKEKYDPYTDDYSKIPVYETVYSTYYYYQEGSDYHIKMNPRVSNYRYIIGGVIWESKFKLFIGEEILNPMELRIPLVRDITYKTSFNNFCDVLEQSTAIAYSTKVTVKVKWYQSGIFMIIMIIVITVINVATGGAASPLYTVLLATASFTLVALSDKLGKWGILAQLALAVIGLMSGNPGAVQNVFMQTVMTATTIISIITNIHNFYWQHRVESHNKKAEKKSKELSEESETVAKEMDEFMGNAVEGGINTFMSTVPEVDEYYDIALGNIDQYDIMYNYGTDIDRLTKLE